MEMKLLQASSVVYLVATLIAGWAVLRPGTLPRRSTTVSLAVGFLLQFVAFVTRSFGLGGIALPTFPDQVAFFTMVLVGVYLVTAVRYQLAVLAAVVGDIDRNTLNEVLQLSSYW